MIKYHNKSEKYIITGGSGFIGTNLIKFLLSRKKNIKIISLDKISYASNNYLLKKKQNNIVTKKINIKDRVKLDRLINSFKPNKIIHLAAESHVDRSIENPFGFINENITATLNILTCTLNYYKKIKKKNNFNFFYIGTDEIYGDLKIKSKKRFSANSKINPGNPYSASKASCYHIVKSFEKTYGLPSTYINFCNNFGEFQFPEKLIPKTILSILNNKPIHIYGNGLQIRNWIYVKDTVSKISKILHYKKKKSVFNVSSNFELNNISIVKMIHKILLNIKKKENVKNLKIKFVKDRPGHDLRYSLVDNTFEKKTIYTQKIFYEKLTKVVEWYLKKNNLKYFNNTKNFHIRRGLK
jgi:dTDP-glucose 4,6-dehydratase